MNYVVLKTLFGSPEKRIAISFVNSALNPTPSICSKLANKIKESEHGYGYKLIDAGYTNLSSIVEIPVKTTEEAFSFIEQAFGSVEKFFIVLESQRLSLESYSRDLIRRKKYIDGSILLYASKLAKNWGRRFFQEYQDINPDNKGINLKNDLSN
jgi:hypothetical protein